MKNWWILFKANFKGHFSKWFPKVCSAFVIVFSVGIAACFVAHLLKPHFIDIYNNNFVITEQENYSKYTPDGLTKQDKIILQSMINQGKVMSVSDVYDRTLDYYDSLITILVFLLGLFAFVSYFSLRGKLKGEVEESVRDVLNSNFFKTILDCEMKKIIQENLPDYVNEDTEINEERIKEFISKGYELQSDKIKEDILESLKTALSPAQENTKTSKSSDKGKEK